MCRACHWRMQSRLERENALVLDTVQAALGLISVPMRAISVQVTPERVILHFALRERNADVDEDIVDVLADLEALQDGPMRMEATVHVGAPDSSWAGRAGRFVYWAKEADSAS